MVADKVRIKKSQKPKVEQWCEALEITESRFVEDAIAFYLRFLEGKYPVVPTIPIVSQAISQEVVPTIPQSTSALIETDDPEEFDGGLEL
ncbi:MAG: hypothetical protein KME57_34580 [Scytonema hyalinum WJT4-NPBG1]|jgi:hypothetical protein|nr:hypothetical protein [Scytonema hyalinum WJT4-NPBG1]